MVDAYFDARYARQAVGAGRNIPTVRGYDTAYRTYNPALYNSVEQERYIS